MEKTLDVRGLSCPEPAMQTRFALKEMGQGTLVVLTDAVTARNNVTRTAEQAGWKVEVVQEADDSFRLTITK